MSVTKKHHFLPEFYLRGFVTDLGKFFVYDYQKGRLKKGQHAPSSHFFEWHRNTVEFEGKSSDFPEQGYSVKDNRFSKLFQFIQSCSGIPALDTMQLLTLQEFVSDIFWRIPKNDTLFREQFATNPLFTKAFKIVRTRTGEEVHNERTEKIKRSDAFMTGFRVSASALTFMAHDSKDIDNWRIVYGPGDFHVCSDSPFILKDEQTKDIFTTEFIFPLTKNHLLIRTFNNLPAGLIPPEFGLLVDLALFKQGERYCAAARKVFLTTLSQIAPNFKIPVLKQRAFGCLDRIVQP